MRNYPILLGSLMQMSDDSLLNYVFKYQENSVQTMRTKCVGEFKTIHYFNDSLAITLVWSTDKEAILYSNFGHSSLLKKLYDEQKIEFTKAYVLNYSKEDVAVPTRNEYKEFIGLINRSPINESIYRTEEKIRSSDDVNSEELRQYTENLTGFFDYLKKRRTH